MVRLRLAAAITLVVCCLAPGLATAQEGLSSGLIRSASTMLEASDQASREFALRLIVVLVGINDLDNARRAALADALERSDVLSKVTAIASGSGELAPLAQTLALSMRARLGLNARDSAVSVDTREGPAPMLQPVSPASDGFRWARFAVTAGQTHQISIQGCDSATVSVFNADMTKLAEAVLFGSSGSLFVPALDAEQELYARFYSPGFCAGQFLVDIAANAAAGSTLAYSNSPDTAPRIEVDETYTVRVPDYDQHWVRFEAVAGALYSIHTSNLRDNADSVLELIDANGQILGYNDDDSGLASRMLLVPEASGVYYVGIEDLSPGGQFDFRVETVLADVSARVRAGAEPEDATELGDPQGIVFVDNPAGDYGYLQLELERGEVVLLESNVFLAIFPPGADMPVDPQIAPAGTAGATVLRGSYYIATVAGRHVIEIDAYLEELVLLRVTRNPFER